jgi:hypothetical protein
MWTELAALRDALAVIDGVASCKVGIEQNMSPADYPMIRLVPERVLPGKYKNRTVELGIYFGADKSSSEGMELVYQTLSELEDSIIAVLKVQGGRFVETITDEDRLDTYKIMLIRCEIDAARPADPV